MFKRDTHSKYLFTAKKGLKLKNNIKKIKILGSCDFKEFCLPPPISAQRQITFHKTQNFNKCKSCGD